MGVLLVPRRPRRSPLASPAVLDLTTPVLSTPVCVPPPFSLLVAVYAGDRPAFVRRALVSSVLEQTLPPAELVLVQDGPVGAEMAALLDQLAASLPLPVRRVHLGANGGLGPAMEAGLAACAHDVVARMDADDVSLPERFARTLPLIAAGADLVGTGLYEIADDETVHRARRQPPTTPALIASSARLHDPFNHPSVVYRRSAVAAAGGYLDLPLMEDYWLFARMIAGGAVVGNVAEPLLLYRVVDGGLQRRGGLPLLVAELRLQRAMRGCGFTTRAQCVRNVLLRGTYRLVPGSLRRVAYRGLVAGRGGRLDRRAEARQAAVPASRSTS